MCLSPLTIPNPNKGRRDSFAQYKDTTSDFILVPCGHCPECIARRQMQFVQRLQMEELVNHFFFCTLTYNNETLPHVVTSTGYDIRYADVSDVQKMFKRLRKRDAFGRPFRHFAVSELGSAKGRPHFHILFMLPKYVGDDHNTCLNLQSVLYREVLSEWKRNVAVRWCRKNGKYVPDTRNPVYKPLCTFVQKFVRGRIRSNYDLHYVNPATSDGGTADVCFYVLKYMMKPSDRAVRLQQALRLNLEDDEYRDTWNIVKPRHFESEALGFGWSMRCIDPNDARVLYHPHPKVFQHLRNGIEQSKALGLDSYAAFVSPVDGKRFPLADYYERFSEILSMQDFLDFFYLSTQNADNVFIHEDMHPSQAFKRFSDYKKKADNVAFQQSSDELDELFEPDDFTTDF